MPLNATIAVAICDMNEWYQRHADELEAGGRRRNGGAEVIGLSGPGGAA
jgi:hypothetical protein